MSSVSTKMIFTAAVLLPLYFVLFGATDPPSKASESENFVAVEEQLSQITRTGAIVDPPGVVRIEAEDEAVVHRHGEWQMLNDFPRNANKKVLRTSQPDARLSFTFTGRSLVLVLPGTWQDQGPRYGKMPVGGLEIRVGDRLPTFVDLTTSPQNVMIYNNLPGIAHEVIVIPRLAEGGHVTIDGFKVGDHMFSTLSFRVIGEESASLNDVRAIVSSGGRVVSSTVTRHAHTGECLVTGLQPGTYNLEVHAMGWEPVRREGIVIGLPGDSLRLETVILRRQERARGHFYGIVWPNRGRTAFLMPGDTFDAFCRNGTGAKVLSAALKTAHLKVPLEVVDPEIDRYYYENTVRLRLPEELPRGLYDLEVHIIKNEGEEGYPVLAPQAVQVRDELGEAFYLVGFGHTNTWGQVTAEWMGELAEVINLINPEFVLISNEVNWAYLAGALSKLRVPYFITTGNHCYPNYEIFYGARLSVFDCGPIRGVNVGPIWAENWPAVRRAFDDRPDATIRLINTYEPNVPVEDLLDVYGVRLIHDAHGPGDRIDQWGTTPTWRVGKTNSNSFRLIRFRDGHVVSATYQDDAVEPIPFPRSGSLPLIVTFNGANDGTNRELTAEIINKYDETFENAEVQFIMAKGEYTTSRGRITQQYNSSDTTRTIVHVAVEVEPTSIQQITVRSR